MLNCATQEEKMLRNKKFEFIVSQLLLHAIRKRLGQDREELKFFVDNSTVEKEDDDTVEKEDDGTVEKEDDGTVEKEDDSTVEKEDNGTVEKEKNAEKKAVPSEFCTCDDEEVYEYNNEQNTENLLKELQNLRQEVKLCNKRIEKMETYVKESTENAIRNNEKVIKQMMDVDAKVEENSVEIQTIFWACNEKSNEVDSVVKRVADVESQISINNQNLTDFKETVNVEMEIKEDQIQYANKYIEHLNLQVENNEQCMREIQELMKIETEIRDDQIQDTREEIQKVKSDTRLDHIALSYLCDYMTAKLERMDKQIKALCNTVEVLSEFVQYQEKELRNKNLLVQNLYTEVEKLKCERNINYFLLQKIMKRDSEIKDTENDVKQLMAALRDARSKIGKHDNDKSIKEIQENIHTMCQFIKKYNESNFAEQIKRNHEALDHMKNDFKKEINSLYQEINSLKRHKDNQYTEYMTDVPEIPGLKQEAIQACKSRNWSHCVKILKENLDSTSAAYYQLIRSTHDVLMSIGKCGYVELAAVFLKNNFPVNYYISGKYTLCHIAAEYGHKHLVEFLLLHGADVKPRDNTLTPLHIAAQNGHVQVVDLLLQRGADVDSVSCSVTPLHLAAMFGHVPVIQLLEKYGCDKDLEDEDGNTAYDLFEIYMKGVKMVLLKPQQI